MTQALQIENLTKVYSSDLLKKRFTALRGLSLEVNEGEIFGFVGHNGAGKTTTLKIVTRLLFPTKGRFWIFGKAGRKPASRQPVGFLPEHPYFYDHLSARESLRFYGKLCGLDYKTITKRADEYLAMVGLSYAADRRVRSYSKGMLQRLGMAQAMINDPKLLILDEPMSGLDPIGRSDMKEIILKLHSEGKTIFFSSHILSDVEEISDRVALLVKGKLRAVGEIHELLTDKQEIEVSFEELSAQWLEKFEQRGFEIKHKGSIASVIVPDNQVRDELIGLTLDSDLKLFGVNRRHKTLEELFKQEYESP
jgi:ABC-2 type transport system ATP-binding protein